MPVDVSKSAIDVLLFPEVEAVQTSKAAIDILLFPVSAVEVSKAAIDVLLLEVTPPVINEVLVSKYTSEVLVTKPEQTAAVSKYIQEVLLAEILVKKDLRPLIIDEGDIKELPVGWCLAPDTICPEAMDELLNEIVKRVLIKVFGNWW